MSAKQYGIPTPIQFDRLYAGPLDKHEVFDSYTDALIYAQGSISYPGQTIGVKKSGLKEDVYVVNQDKSLSRLMIQREDIRVVLYADKWIGDCPYEQSVSVPYLESTDNCIISLGETVNDPDVVREIVNAKIADTIQETGSIKFIARGSVPKVDIPITITIGSVVSAVEIPNNVNDNTNHTVVIAKKDAWEGTKPPYTQELYVFGVRPDSNGTIGINPDSSYTQIDKMAAATAGVVKYEQKNNYVTIAAMNSKPTRDLEVLVVWGDEIVVFENSDTLEDFNVTKELVLKANNWTTYRPYRQTLTDQLEGLSEYHTGAIGLSDKCTVSEAEIGLNAGLELIEQGNGYVIIEASDILPTVDLPIYLTYGSNITIVPSPEYVGEANRHVDTVAYASKWVKTVNGWEQEVDVEGITSNSIGTMGLRNGATNEQVFSAATGKIKITKVYDNKVLLTATGARPILNIPLCFVFGRNINVAKYPGLIGKVSLNATYLPFDDTLINSNLSNLQELLEYLQKNKINYSDVVDSVHDGDLHKDYIPEVDSIWEYNKPLSARMGRYLYLRKINHDDVIDNLITDDSYKPLSARMGKLLNDNFNNFKKKTEDNFDVYNKSISNLQSAISNTVIVIDKNKPDLTNEKYENKNVLWINTEGVKQESYIIEFDANGGTNAPASINGIVGNAITIPSTKPIRNGYIFDGWNTIGGSEYINAGNQYIFNNNSIKDGKLTLYAAWTPSNIKVTLDNQSATSSGTSEFYYTYGNNVLYYKNTFNEDDKITNNTITVPTRSGYIFNGYFTKNNGAGIKYVSSDGVIDTSIINYISNVTLYAYWFNNFYTITYDANGGTNAPNSQTESANYDIILSSDEPSREDYEFLGWAKNPLATTPELYPGTLYNERISVTLYAVWSAPVSTINLNSKTGLVNTIYAKDNIIYSDSDYIFNITNVDIPNDNKGYIFTGYYSESDGTGVQYISKDGTFNSNIYTLESTNLYAGWEKATYTITFNANGGTGIPDSITAKYLDTIKIPNTIPKYLDYYKFVGWTDDNGEAIYSPGTLYEVTDNITLYAIYELILEMNLDNQSATIPNTTKIYYLLGYDNYYIDDTCDTEIYSITIPEKTGKVFDGYYSEPNENGDTIQYISSEGTFINSLYNVMEFNILYAKWK